MSNCAAGPGSNRSSWTAWAIVRLRTPGVRPKPARMLDRKSTRLNSSHLVISYAVFCLKKNSLDDEGAFHNPFLSAFPVLRVYWMDSPGFRSPPRLKEPSRYSARMYFSAPTEVEPKSPH